jgi:hypothetical protein
MATGSLQFEHNGSQIFWFDFIADIGLADVMVLAVLAAQVTACEKDRPRTAPATQRILFAKVGAMAC